MKKIALLLIILIAISANAQFKLKVNGKPVAEATVIKAEEIKKMEVAFDKPQKNWTITDWENLSSTCNWLAKMETSMKNITL